MNLDNPSLYRVIDITIPGIASGSWEVKIRFVIRRNEENTKDSLNRFRWMVRASVAETADHTNGIIGRE